jgi:hypothetical protein
MVLRNLGNLSSQKTELSMRRIFVSLLRDLLESSIFNCIKISYSGLNQATTKHTYKFN